MYVSRFALVVAPFVALWGQTPPPKTAAPHPKSVTVPIQVPGVKPAPGKQPTVTLTTEEAGPQAGSQLPEVAPDKVIMSVGDEKITAREFASIIDTLPAQYRDQARGSAGRMQLAENLVRLKVLAHEARKRDIDKSAAFTFQAENMLAMLYYQDMVKAIKVPDEESLKYYTEHKADYEQVQAKHILIRMKGSPVPIRPSQPELTEEQAKAKAEEIRTKLLAGADFAALARTESDDTGSGAKGGDLGTFRHGQMVPAFDQAAFSLPVGQVSEPVKTQFGYHLILVTKHESRTYADARAEIDKRLAPQIAQKEVEDLRKQIPVTLDPDYFKKEAN